MYGKNTKNNYRTSLKVGCSACFVVGFRFLRSNSATYWAFQPHLWGFGALGRYFSACRQKGVFALILTVLCFERPAMLKTGECMVKTPKIIIGQALNGAELPNFTGKIRFHPKIDSWEHPLGCFYTRHRLWL